VRSIFGGSLEEARKHRRLRHRDVADVLVEIEFGCRGGPEAAAAHIGAVEIHRENFAFGQVGFKPEGDERLLDLAIQGPLIRQEQVLGQLLGEGGAALHNAAGACVFRQSPTETEQIDAPMLEESPIFGRQHRLDERIGQFIDRHLS